MPKHDRLKPLAREHWDERTRAVLGGTPSPVADLEGRKASGGPLNILRTIAHHPHLLEPFLGFAATLATRGVLPRRESELLALRAAWNCDSAFEWGHHVHYARAAGLREAEILCVARAVGEGGWSESDRWLLRAADQLHASQDLDQETWIALRDRWSEAQLVEIPFVVGLYTMLSMVANSTGVPLEEDLPEMPPR